MNRRARRCRCLIVAATLATACTSTRSDPRHGVHDPTAHSIGVGADAVAGMLADVAGSPHHEYSLHDDKGESMDSLKVTQAPQGGYLGVYHIAHGQSFTVELATSTDLSVWTRRAELDPSASQPTLAKLSDGSFLLAVEVDRTTRPGERWVRLRHYADLHALLTASPDQSFNAPNTLSRVAQGTPNIYSATLSPDLAHSTIYVGFHYLSGDVDRQGRATLTNFRSWQARPDSALDQALNAAGATGGHGGRDAATIDGISYAVYEAQTTPGGSWQVYLRAGSPPARHLEIRTNRGSTSFANPKLTVITTPSRQLALLVTLFVPASGAAHGEAGELLYYHDLPASAASKDFVVAAAGDIACPAGELVSPIACQQDATADLVQQIHPNAVLALGDLQYEHGSLANFDGSYTPSWGKFRSITYPVIGNHDYAAGGATGYFEYWGNAAGRANEDYYSFDIGAWHVVALNSECDQFGQAGCAPNSPQLRWLAQDLAAHPTICTLAIWHRPLYTSGVEGPASATRPIWQTLYAAGADLVLNGHDHDYERFAPQDPDGHLDSAKGITQIVIGTGGKSLHNFGRALPNSVKRISGSFGVLRLTLHPTGYDWAFLAVGRGQPMDEGSGTCH